MSVPATIAIGAAPIPAGARSVLVFGGTFDPPHRGHVVLPAKVRARLGLDWVLYIPAARNPLKASGPLADDESRLAMLRAALEGQGRASISTLELERSAGPSYTVDTLRALHSLLPGGTTLRLLIGADSAGAFHRWREAREVIALAEPVVMLRRPAESADMLIEAMRPHWSPADLEAWRRRIADVPMIDASATEIREWLRSPVANLSRLEEALSPAVLGVIRSRGLYRG